MDALAVRTQAAALEGLSEEARDTLIMMLTRIKTNLTDRGERAREQAAG